ncbi:heavy metal translocating P-type ATPase [Kandleria vitulina]|uniref:heavy metal translocating P-type ATPase n=1 Tax=Kandleria vitulina TaxID=1630 RepID=UPI00048AE7B7|nr:heavy metal translocating P-type ATPase [Kandleria vitulina]MEE0988052.1 heavy metal translocating P-type ATPase [Kandleria vitulina]
MSSKLKKALQKIIIAFVLYVILIIFEHSNIVPAMSSNRLIMFVLYLIPYMIVGYSVVRKAVLGIKHRQLFDESFLMALATVGAFVTGENAEAVAVMLFYQVGEWFQSYAVGRSRKSISDLMDIAPEYANLVKEDGEVEVVDPYDVEVGNTLLIKPGERIPVDGVVLSGTSMINTSALTGESVPRFVKEGDEVISGCINGETALRISASKMYEDSTVSKILELVENASSKKSKTENFITRFARVYTPVVVISALILALVPPLFVGHFSTWIYRACTFLVISCPCALVISVPLAFFGGIGAASSEGVLVKGSNYLEQLSKVDVIVSDKTGTLTQGKFKVNEVIEVNGKKDEILHLAALAEGYSTHPIALSILDAVGEDIDHSLVSDSRNVVGQGIIARLGDDLLYVGNKTLMDNHHIEAERIDSYETLIYVAKNTELLGIIKISDAIKKEARGAIQSLYKNGVKTFMMLTGDKEEVAKHVADELHISKYYAELLPGEKVEKVEEILSGSHNALAFIGDGINDAPVLSRADIGIAMGSLGSDAAIEAADVVIMDDDLSRLSKVIHIAKKTLSISKENIAFSLFIKIGTLILGALGIANMWMAVFADVGVAFLCIINSLRILKKS